MSDLIYGLKKMVDDCYIDTGILPTINTKIVIECEATLGSAAGFTFGSRSSVTSDDKFCQYITNVNYNPTTSLLLMQYGDINDATISNIGIPTMLNTRRVIEMDKTGVVVDGEYIKTFAEDVTFGESTNTIYLFGLNCGYLEPREVRNFVIYSFKIYENDELIMDLVAVPQGVKPTGYDTPAPSNCMFDMVSETYFENGDDGTEFTVTPYTPPEIEEATSNGMLVNDTGIDRCIFNGVEVDRVVMNGVERWRKAGKLAYIYDYIGSTGTQYIDTGVILPDTDTFAVNGTWSDVDNSSTSYIYGSDNGAYDNNCFSFIDNHSQTVHRLTFYTNGEAGTGSQNNPYISDYKYFTTKQKRTGCSINSGAMEPYFDTNQQAYPTHPIYLFCQDRNGDPAVHSKVNCHAFSITQTDDAPLINLVPVKRASDGVVCMYDTVSNSYFENEGTGDFVPGNVIGYISHDGECYYYEREWALCSFGDEYIDIGMTANQDSRVKIDGYFQTEIAPVGSTIGYFGARNDQSNQFWTGLYTYNNMTTTLRYIRYGEGSTVSSYKFTMNPDTPYVLEINKNKAVINDEVIKTFDEQTFITDNLLLFAYNYDDTVHQSSNRIKSFQFYQDADTSISRKFIPVPKCDTTYSDTPAPSNCMWDTVTNQYFTNVGTGNFGIYQTNNGGQELYNKLKENGITMSPGDVWDIPTMIALLPYAETQAKIVQLDNLYEQSIDAIVELKANENLFNLDMTNEFFNADINGYTIAVEAGDVHKTCQLELDVELGVEYTFHITKVATGTASGTSPGLARVYCKDEDGGINYAVYMDLSPTLPNVITFDEEYQYGVCMILIGVGNEAATTDFTVSFSEIKIETGSTQTAWIPSVANQNDETTPIPIPTYEVTRCGRNLLPFANIFNDETQTHQGSSSFDLTEYTITMISDGNPCFTDTGILTSGQLPESIRGNAIPVQSSTIYQISLIKEVLVDGADVNIGYITEYDENYNVIKYYPFSSLGVDMQITMSDNTAYICIRFDCGATIIEGEPHPSNLYKNIQIELGSVTNAYEPYQGDVINITPNTPTTISMLKGINTFFVNYNMKVTVKYPTYDAIVIMGEEAEILTSLGIEPGENQAVQQQQLNDTGVE